MGLWGVNWIQWKALMEAIDYIEKIKEYCHCFLRKLWVFFLNVIPKFNK